MITAIVIIERINASICAGIIDAITAITTANITTGTIITVTVIMAIETTTMATMIAVITGSPATMIAVTTARLPASHCISTKTAAAINIRATTIVTKYKMPVRLKTLH